MVICPNCRRQHENADGKCPFCRKERVSPALAKRIKEELDESPETFDWRHKCIHCGGEYTEWDTSNEDLGRIPIHTCPKAG
jgi:hypothetical protein